MTQAPPVTDEERASLQQALTTNFIDGLIHIDCGCDAFYLGNNPELCKEIADDAANVVMALGYRKPTHSRRRRRRRS